MFNYKFAFHTAGMEYATRKAQLSAFREELKKQGHPQCPRLSSWIAAFSELETMLEKMPDGEIIRDIDSLLSYSRSGLSKVDRQTTQDSAA